MTGTGLDIDALPGAELVERGIEDLRQGQESAEALLVPIERAAACAS